MTKQVYDQREDLHALGLSPNSVNARTAVRAAQVAAQEAHDAEREAMCAGLRRQLGGPYAYATAPNPSGIIPMDLRILVRPDTVEEKSKGGIILPESAQEKEKYAQCKATVVAIGENAFEEAASRSPAFVKPQPGTRVLIAKYGGVLLKGNDGVEYRIMNDEDIIARLEE